MKGRKRRSSDRYSAFEGGEHIPVPDYAMFRKACEMAAKELGLPFLTVCKLYRDYVSTSIGLMLPEDNPGALSDEELLHPRRRIQIPHVATAEITEKSLYRWRAIQQRIKDKKEQNKDE